MWTLYFIAVPPSPPPRIQSIATTFVGMNNLVQSIARDFGGVVSILFLFS